MLKRTATIFLLAAALASVGAGQKKSQPTTGGVKGKVRVDTGSVPGGVDVTVRRGEEEIARTETDGKGQFELRGLAPGQYTLTLRKAGLKTAQIRPVEIKAGKVGSLPERVFLPADEGALVFLKGSVFDADGRSVRGARIEVALIKE
ncbi:MAG: carboxypeptidase regulatory-like domain-containing protein, partial [Acidobacteria bacterium]|nr:carboxypeptidase regulatory-like domain-containing protein [Acidobacteriota bacterium]